MTSQRQFVYVWMADVDSRVTACTDRLHLFTLSTRKLVATEPVLLLIDFMAGHYFLRYAPIATSLDIQTTLSGLGDDGKTRVRRRCWCHGCYA